jgi:hypothetical protein
VEAEVLSDDQKKGFDLAVRSAGRFGDIEHEVVSPE